MRRREVLALAGSAALGWPAAVRAQQPTLPVIGYLSSVTAAQRVHLQAALHKGLSEAGFVEGQNVAFAYRWAEGDADRLPTLAADLVNRRAAVIVATGGDAAALAAKAATATTPIVFVIGGDPVRYGLVASFNRPGGNVTGAVVLTSDLVAKRLELTRELLPNAKAISLLVNPTSPIAESIVADAQAVAVGYGWRLNILKVGAPTEIAAALAAHVRDGADAVVVTSGSYFVGSSERLIAFAAQHAVPVVYDRSEFVADGGLISYGANHSAAHHQAGVYVGRILKGMKPADLPVFQATTLELVVNLKAARALRLTVPQSIFARADEVIE